MGFAWGVPFLMQTLFYTLGPISLISADKLSNFRTVQMEKKAAFLQAIVFTVLILD